MRGRPRGPGGRRYASVVFVLWCVWMKNRRKKIDDEIMTSSSMSIVA